jgi:Zn-dependent protease
VKPYYRIPGFRILGAPVSVHWSVLGGTAFVLLLSWDSPLIVAVSLVCYFSVILLHETGHAFVARRVRARPVVIRIGIVHGECLHDEPHYEKDDYLIAWGGVAAQVLVAVPLILVNAVTGFASIDPLGPIVGILGYVSLGIAGFNLLPVPGLDGAKAWRLFPLLYGEWRQSRGTAARRGRGRFKVVK